MSFLSKIKFWGETKPSNPDIAFGRYSDAYKTPAQRTAWEASVAAFEAGKVVEAYRSFFEFLRDPKEDNVQWKEQNGALLFEFRQGSRRISGKADALHVKAESRIALAEDLHVGFLRRLVEQNFSLKFCRYALSPENCLVIIFDTLAIDGSPYKLLNAFKELAVHADKQDDLLLDEFRSLLPAEQRADPDVPVAEKEAKYRYVQVQIAAAFEALDTARPDPNQYPGGYVYMLLSLAFSLDYLIRPEGFMMDALERIFNTYFSKDQRTPAAKVQALRAEFQRILERPKQSLFDEMYRTRSTFGINPSVGHDRIQNIIDGELPKMEWHLQQKHPEMIALAVPKYIVGYAFFHYSPPPPDRDLLHLFFRVTEPELFRELGFTPALADAAKMPQKAAIEKNIREIAEKYRPQYPRLKPDLTRIDYSSLALFAKSYLEMLRNIDLGV